MSDGTNANRIFSRTGSALSVAIADGRTAPKSNSKSVPAGGSTKKLRRSFPKERAKNQAGRSNSRQRFIASPTKAQGSVVEARPRWRCRPSKQAKHREILAKARGRTSSVGPNALFSPIDLPLERTIYEIFMCFSLFVDKLQAFLFQILKSFAGFFFDGLSTGRRRHGVSENRASEGHGVFSQTLAHLDRLQCRLFDLLEAGGERRLNGRSERCPRGER